MPGNPDPSLWQAFTDSRFGQALVTGLAMAVAVGYAVRDFLSRQKPKTQEDADLKARLDGGLIKQIAHDLHELRETQQDLRERVVRIETILEGRNGK